MATAPGRRQSTRQVVRTSRPQNYYARNFSGRNLGDAPNTNADAQPGFFPAITHFTDAVDALPKEVIRHVSMLKEVDAKLHASDEQNFRLAETIDRLPPPTRARPPPHAYFPNLSVPNSVDGSRHGSVVGSHASDGTLTNDGFEAVDRERQALFYNMNANMMAMIPALDEKIAVLSTANQTLQRQLDRMMSSFIHVADEVSEEARLGNPKHWAYVTDKETKKAPERSRRDVANANANTLAAAAAAVAEGEFASRSEARREAVAARKSRAHQVDSDFDDRPAAKKGPSKSKKTATEDPKSVGLGIANGVSAPSKRKKAPGGAAMERSLSGVFGNASKVTQPSPRETPDIAPKKRAKPGPAPKKRVAGGASPYLTSSPVIGAFATKEPATRPGQGRGRQNSATNSIASAQVESKHNRPPSSHSNRPPNGIAGLSAFEQLQASASATDPAEPLKPLPRPHQIPSLEDADQGEDATMQDVEPPVLTRAGRSSKTATPMSGVFPESTAAQQQRSRSARATKETATASGSHASSESGEHQNQQRSTQRRTTKTAKATAAAAAATTTTTATNSNASAAPSLHNEPLVPSDGSVIDQDEADDAEELDGEEGEEGNEPKYCYCNDVSYGEMVACDNERCEREWFHLKCAGLARAPDENTKWYCDDCKVLMRDAGKGRRPVSRREG